MKSSTCVLLWKGSVIRLLHCKPRWQYSFEDPDLYLTRSPTAASGDKGAAARELVYAHAQQADRVRMAQLEEVINKSTSRLDDLEATLAF